MFDEDLNAEYEFEMKNKLTDEELRDKIQKGLNIKDINQIREYNKKIRNEQIKKLGIIKGVSKTQIARVIRVKRGIVIEAMTK